MTRYALLLRAVNVAGTGRLPMADLRALLASRGYADATTYLASGNAVVTADRDAETVSADVAAALRDELGLDTAVLVRSGAELAAVVADNPFPEAAAAAPKLLHAAFLSGPPDPGWVASTDPDAHAPDVFRVGDRVLYLRYAEGAGRSKLGPAVFKGAGVVATARNWNTVLALARMTEG